MTKLLINTICRKLTDPRSSANPFQLARRLRETYNDQETIREIVTKFLSDPDQTGAYDVVLEIEQLLKGTE